MWLNKVLCLIHTPRVTINSTYSKRFVVRLYIYITINWLMHFTGNVERFHDWDQTTAIHHIGCNGAAQTAAARRWLPLRRLLLFYSGKRAWAHLRRPRKGCCCCCCWMLIGEAFRDRIHPHADAIYRSAADVLVSPSFDDEINKLCAGRRCPELWCPRMSRSF